MRCHPKYLQYIEIHFSLLPLETKYPEETGTRPLHSPSPIAIAIGSEFCCKAAWPVKIGTTVAWFQAADPAIGQSMQSQQKASRMAVCEASVTRGCCAVLLVTQHFVQACSGTARSTPALDSGDGAQCIHSHGHWQHCLPHVPRRSNRHSHLMPTVTAVRLRSLTQLLPLHTAVH